jgi:hypothetical protein
MVAVAIHQKEESLDGCEVFFNFLNAVRAAKEGDTRLIALFDTLKVDFGMDPLAIYGFILSQKPLSIEKALALKEIIAYRGE